MCYKVLFMNEPNTSLDALQDIRRMMERSNRFLSLSGFSGIAAGFWALVGACFAYNWLATYYVHYETHGYKSEDFQNLKWSLIFLAGAVLAAALLSAYYFTWRRAAKTKVPLWNRSTRMLVGSLLVPLVTGGVLIVILLLQSDEWRLIVPLTLIFYGLALVSGSRYTLSDIRYLGFCEIMLGLISTQATGYGLYFWAAGFGLLHILYGSVMWWKYERKSEASFAD